MKKMLMLAAALGAAASATPVKPATFFNVSNATLTSVCSAGYSAGEASSATDGLTPYLYGLNQGVIFQTSEGGIFSSCRTDAKALKEQPSTIPAAPLLVLINGTTTGSPRDTEKWATALVISDAAGKELARLIADTVNAGDSSWKVDCSSGTCTWSGINYYLFGGKTPIPDAFKKAANDPKAVSLAVLVSRGNGVERYVVDSSAKGHFQF